MWEDILKMMVPSEFMEQVKKHVEGGEIENKTKHGKKKQGDFVRNVTHLELRDSNNRVYKLMHDPRISINPNQEYSFRFHKYAGADLMKEIRGYNLKKMLELFKGMWKYDSEDIENMGPLGALLVGGAAQGVKTVAENVEGKV